MKWANFLGRKSKLLLLLCSILQDLAAARSDPRDHQPFQSPAPEVDSHGRLPKLTLKQSRICSGEAGTHNRAFPTNPGMVGRGYPDLLVLDFHSRVNLSICECNISGRNLRAASFGQEKSRTSFPGTLT
ncbi:hypothetical protein TNCV_601631 [Trichonephila clavipes]|nr:hypothetical protein TNCV_601631 [Trichonephila clavipes]